MKVAAPKLVAWELTNRCNLRCRHCRAADAGDPAPDELSHVEALELVAQISEMGPLTLILSGGEPLVREDFLDITREAIRRKLRVAVATNGTLLDDDRVRILRDEGVSRVSLSLDGATDASHDSLRGLDGARKMVLVAAERLKSAGLPFQINTTVTLGNVDELRSIVDQVPGVGAVEHHIFMFVPTGRGEKMADESLSAARYEEILRWLASIEDTSPIRIQVTCAPHYQRIKRQLAGEGSTEGQDSRPAGAGGGPRGGGGCLAGTAFVFVSSKGEVFPCGYLPIPAGDVRVKSLGEIWRSAPLFADLRDRKKLDGRCGACEYRKVCGGCRARAYAVGSRLLGEEPYCTHVPARLEGRGICA